MLGVPWWSYQDNIELVQYPFDILAHIILLCLLSFQDGEISKICYYSDYKNC